MKKTLILCLAILTSISTIFTCSINFNEVATFAYSISNSNDKIIVELDDIVLNISKNPIIKEGTTLVPLREIANAMNISVSWDQKTKTILCSKDDIYLTLRIDNNVMKSSEDSDVILDVPPTLIDNVTFVPLRAISQGFNSQVYWDSDSQTISIYSPIKTEDAVLASKLKKLSLYIYALNDGICLDKGSYMTLAKVLKPEYEMYQEEFTRFSEILNTNVENEPFGKISITYSNINACELQKAKKVLNLSEDSVDVLIDKIKEFAYSIDCKIPEFADYMAEIELYEKYIENYTVREIDDSLDNPYIFKEKYKSAERSYNRHIKKMDKFKKNYFSGDSEELIPKKEILLDAEDDLEKILDDLKTIYINLGISKKTIRTPDKLDIKPLIKADLYLTLYLKYFIKTASDLNADKNGKTLKKKYADFQTKYNSLYLKTLDIYSKLFNLNQQNPDFATAFETINWICFIASKTF